MHFHPVFLALSGVRRYSPWRELTQNDSQLQHVLCLTLMLAFTHQHIPPRTRYPSGIDLKSPSLIPTPTPIHIAT